MASTQRAAINARLQGTAADIIRRAMIRMDATLAKAKVDARMLLQVHDELIFEVAEKDVKKTLPLSKKRDGGSAAARGRALYPAIRRCACRA